MLRGSASCRRSTRQGVAKNGESGPLTRTSGCVHKASQGNPRSSRTLKRSVSIDRTETENKTLQGHGRLGRGRPGSHHGGEGKGRHRRRHRVNCRGAEGGTL